MTLSGAPFSGVAPLLLFLAKATLLLAIAYAATILLRRATAGTRHLVWLATLVGVLALPLLARAGSMRLPVLPESLAPAASSAPASPAATVASRAAAVIGTPALGVGARGEGTVADAAGGSRANAMAAVSPGAASPRAAAEPSFSSAPSLMSTLQLLALVWAGVAIVLLGWLAVGTLSVRRIAKRARALVSPDWTAPLCEAADRMDLEIVPRLLVSDEIEMAFACRALTPTIVLPASAEAWSEDRRRAVLMHELAHVKRLDLVGHGFGRLACALYWFHPLVWAAAKHLRAESERACDDLVLSCGTLPSDYAQHLLDMVTSVRRHGAPAMALPMARKKEFEGRMLAILDPAARRAAPRRAQAAAVVATIGVLSLSIAAVSPRSRQPSESIARSAGPSPSEAASPRLTAVDTPARHRTPALDTTSDNAQATPADIAKAVSGLAGVIQTSSLVADVSQAAASAASAASAMSSGYDAAAPSDTARVGLLIHVLATDADASVRRTAAWGLNGVQRPDARDALTKALRGDASPSVREMAAWALASYDEGDVVTVLDDGLRDKSSDVRATSAWAIGTLGAAGDGSALANLLADSSAHVRELAIWAMGQGQLRTAPRALTGALADQTVLVRELAAWSLGQIGDGSAAPAVIAVFPKEQAPEVRTAELWALTKMGKASPAVLDDALKSPDASVRRRAVSLLAGDGSGEVWPWPWPWPWPRPFPN